MTQSSLRRAEDRESRGVAATVRPRVEVNTEVPFFFSSSPFFPALPRERHASVARLVLITGLSFRPRRSTPVSNGKANRWKAAKIIVSLRVDPHGSPVPHFCPVSAGISLIRLTVARLPASIVPGEQTSRRSMSLWEEGRENAPTCFLTYFLPRRHRETWREVGDREMFTSW